MADGGGGELQSKSWIKAWPLLEKDLDFNSIPKSCRDCRPAAAMRGSKQTGRTEAAAGVGNAY